MVRVSLTVRNCSGVVIVSLTNLQIVSNIAWDIRLQLIDIKQSCYNLMILGSLYGDLLFVGLLKDQ